VYRDSTVFIVDDDAAVLDSLGILLTTLGMNVESFDSGQAFLDVYDQDCKGCLVLDIRMPNMSGLELMRRLAQINAPIPCIIMTAHGDIKIAVEAMKLGAVEFVEKPFKEDLIIESIQSALEQDVKTRTNFDLMARFQENVTRLTTREQEVFGEMIKGNLNKVIATELGISPRTVEIHRARVMEKLQVRNYSQLLKMAIVSGYG